MANNKRLFYLREVAPSMSSPVNPHLVCYKGSKHTSVVVKIPSDYTIKGTDNILLEAIKKLVRILNRQMERLVSVRKRRDELMSEVNRLKETFAGYPLHLLHRDCRVVLTKKGNDISWVEIPAEGRVEVWPVHKDNPMVEAEEQYTNLKITPMPGTFSEGWKAITENITGIPGLTHKVACKINDSTGCGLRMAYATINSSLMEGQSFEDLCLKILGPNYKENMNGN